MVSVRYVELTGSQSDLSEETKKIYVRFNVFEFIDKIRYFCSIP